MAKNPFDLFSKQLLEEVFSPYGSVEISLEVPGESQFVDVFFEPSIPSAIALQEIGILGRMGQTACLLEPFRNQPTPVEVRSCLKEAYQVHGEYLRKARRDQETVPENELPYLWILVSSASDTLLAGFGATPNEDWELGVYFLPPLLPDFSR